MITLIAQKIDIREQAQNIGLPGSSHTSPEAGMSNLIGTIVQAVTVVASIILLIYLIWGGIDWITSGGDSGKVENARTKITNAIIGMIVLASTIAVFTLVQHVLGLNVINFMSI